MTEPQQLGQIGASSGTASSPARSESTPRKKPALAAWKRSPRAAASSRSKRRRAIACRGAPQSPSAKARSTWAIQPVVHGRVARSDSSARRQRLDRPRRLAGSAQGRRGRQVDVAEDACVRLPSAAPASQVVEEREALTQVTLLGDVGRLRHVDLGAR